MSSAAFVTFRSYKNVSRLSLTALLSMDDIMGLFDSCEIKETFKLDSNTAESPEHLALTAMRWPLPNSALSGLQGQDQRGQSNRVSILCMRSCCQLLNVGLRV